MSLIAELQRRKVFKVGAAYLVVAWLAVQAASITFPTFEAPLWALRIFILVALLGFPIAVVMAWVLDVTPEGIKLDASASGTKRLFAAAGLLIVLALGWYFYGQPAFRKGVPPVPKAATAPVPNTLPTAIPEKSIAVLPFENLSGNADNAYFVSGMQDLILTNLSKISELKVISRTSTEKYASHPGNLKQVGVELGVATLLEGSVQRSGDQVLINLQLIDARTDTHLWAETYSRKVEDVFAVEQEVAKTVADALQAKLSPTESAAIASKPTQDAAAYDLFLRAEYLSHQGTQNQDREVLAQAIALYRQAIAADPGFALAQANLSIALSYLYWNGGTRSLSPQSLAQQSQAAMAAAKRMQPNLPEANLAAAFGQYRLRLDFPAAVTAFDAVLAVRPGDARALAGKALPLRRLGRFAESIAAFDAAAAVSPRDSFLMTTRAETHWMVRHTSEAEAGFRRALALDPDNVQATLYLSNLRLYRQGDTAGAWAVLRGDRPEIALQRVAVLAFQRKYAEALRLLAPIPDSVVAYIASDNPKSYWSGRLYFAAGQRAEAEPLLRQAKAELEARLGSLPANYGNGQTVRLALADVEAMLGNEAAAIQTARQALALLPIEKDAVNGAIALAQAAQVYARLGRADLVTPALERLRLLPGADTSISASILKLDPVWDKVRADPGFQSELQRWTELELQ